MTLIPCLVQATTYRAIRPVSRKVWKMMFSKIPPAGGPILQLPSAQADTRNLYQKRWQNLTTDGTNSGVVHLRFIYDGAESQPRGEKPLESSFPPSVLIHGSQQSVSLPLETRGSVDFARQSCILARFANCTYFFTQIWNCTQTGFRDHITCLSIFDNWHAARKRPT